MTAEETSFEIRKPPRKVPGVTRRKLLFGGPVKQIGWGFTGFGLVIFVIFGLNCEFINKFTFSGTTDFTKGAIVSTEETNASENEEPIYKVEY